MRGAQCVHGDSARDDSTAATLCEGIINQSFSREGIDDRRRVGRGVWSTLSRGVLGTLGHLLGTYLRREGHGVRPEHRKLEFGRPQAGIPSS